MIKCYEREALVETSTKDVILAGKVAKVTEKKTSKAGNGYLKVTLAGTTIDPELELEVAEEYEILFFDKQDGQFGPQMNATQVEKLKLKEGSYVAIRATESINVNDDDEEEITYFGSRCVFANGCRFNFKFSKRGNEAAVVIGSAIINKNDKGEKTLSVPLRMWDKTKEENYTAWVNVSGDISEAVYEELAPSMGDDNKEHKPLVCVSFDKLDEHKEDGSDRIANYTGKFTSICKVS